MIRKAIIVVLALLVSVLFVWVAWGSRRRTGRWGLNLEAVRCPVCQTRMPTWRRPASFRQALWGGWSCQRCGCEMDKWGTPIFSEGHCRRCGYDLTDNVSGVCPECGTEVVKP